MTGSSLLSLFIAVPLLSAAVAAMAPWSGVRRALGLLVPMFGIGASLWVLTKVSEPHTVMVDNVGGFIGGISIPLAADNLAGIMILTTSVVALVANWFADVVGETRTRFYPALTLMLIGGVWGALLTADLFNLFVFIEVMLMPSFGLLAMTGTWARLAAGRMFIVVNLVTSLLLLSGVVLVYAVVGTTNLAALAGAAGPRGTEFAEGVFGNQWQLVVPLGMVLLALAVKSGVAPVHTWLPRAYPSTSPAVMALFSALHTKVGIYAIFRVYLTVFEGDPTWSWAILVIMVLGMLIGGFAGLGETTMRSVLAYQMVNGIPFILISLAFLSDNARLMISAGLFYMLHHMIVAGSLIMASGAIEETYGSGRVRKLSGLLRRDRFVSIVFAAGALAIVGLPPFSGLWGKLALVFGVAQDGTWKSWVAIGAIIISSIGALVSMIYVWREVFWGRQMNANETDPELRVPSRYVWPSAVMMLISVGMFIGAGPVFQQINKAADNLTDTTAYVEAVLGDPDEAIGVVLPPGPSGLDNVPTDARSSTNDDALKERVERENQEQPAQHGEEH